jgi:glycolate oxidase iron-sulfur subunit
VEYGRVVERARAMIELRYRRPWLERALRNYFFNSVLADFRKLAQWARLARFAQRSGLQRLAQRSGILKLLGFSEVAALAPQIEDKFFFNELGQTFPAIGERRARVAFLAGCVASVAFAELNRATIRVLQKNGVEVVVPKDQACCGALQAHAGFRAQAREQARRNLRAFLGEKFDAIVTNAAGCGSTMKEYYDLLAHDHEFAEPAREFSAKVKDVTEFLAELGLRAPQKKIRARVTYQDPCHLAHGQRIRREPRQLLAALGCELVEMPHSDYCCGSAGSYNITETELSMKILDQKMQEVAGVQPEIIATANVGCMLQLRAGCARSGLKAEVKHVIEMLDESYAD